MIGAALLCSFLTAHLSEAELLVQAESAFLSGIQTENRFKAAQAFKQSAECYEVLCARGVQNAALFANLGQAYLLSGDLPRSILAFRRGVRVNPYDRNLRRGLEFARMQVADSADAAAHSRSLRWPRLPLTNLIGVLLPAILLLCVCILRWLRQAPHASWRCGIAFSFVGLSSIFFFVENAAIDRDAEPIVVVARDGVVLRRGNGESYRPRREAALNRGVEARLLFERSNWLQVQLADGAVGWLPRSSVLADELPR